MELSVRVANVFIGQEIKLVKELCTLDTDALLRFPNFGRKSVRDLQHSLVNALREGPVIRDADELKRKSSTEPAFADESPRDEPVFEPSTPARRIWTEGFLIGFQETFSTLFPKDGDVLARRMGLYGPFETLQEIADDYDLTRERIRQIENRAIKRLARHPDLSILLTSKLQLLLSNRNFPLPLFGVEALDKWFLGLSKSSTALPYILENLCENKFGITRIAGVDYLGYLTQRRWDEILFEGRRLLETGIGEKWSEEDCKALVEAQIQDNSREFKPLLWEEASKLCHFAMAREGHRILVGFGHGAERTVLAVLSAAAEPLHFGKIAEIAKADFGCDLDVRRIHNAAASVAILLGRGIYGLEKHIALSPEDADVIREEAEDCVLSGPVGRQWHAGELLATLMERDFPASLSLDKYVLDYVLQKSTALISLGRLVWTQTKTGSEGVSDRLDVRQAVISLLQNAGTPLSTIEIKQGIVAQRGVNITFQIISADPVVRIGRGLWGLNDRDIPIKRADQPGLLARLIEVIRQQGRGIHISEIHSLVSAFSHPTISPQTVFSLAVQDDRMSANSEQFLFLSEWGSARRESLFVAISDLLSKAEHGISFDQIVELAETRLQRSVNKGSVSKCLQTLNTQYDQQSEKWVLATADEQALDEDDNVEEDPPNLEQSRPESNSILKVPFPFLSGL
jgi:Bacterial RNA polymerase, alpha chain C terminal domain/Sigma-70, region 4